MKPYYAIQVRADGRYEIYVTTNGIDRAPVPRAIFGNPRDAIRYADMRQADVQPLREDDDVDAPGVPLMRPRLREAAHPAS